MSEQIEQAMKYLGLHEVYDNKMLQHLLGFDPAEMAWCAGFVNAIEKACGRRGSGQLAARGYLKYGTPVKTPQLGDIVVFKRGNSSWQGHVAYFIRDDGDVLYVLGGNQSNKVCYAHYAKKDVLGYRRP